MTQLGHRARDVGQMIGDLIERHHIKEFEGANCAGEIINGFLEGYGRVSSDMLSRVAIHAGARVIGWYNRRRPEESVPGTPDQQVAMMRTGIDLVVEGYKTSLAQRQRPLENASLGPCFLARYYETWAT